MLQNNRQQSDQEKRLFDYIRRYNQAVNTLNTYQGGYRNLTEADINGYTISGYSLAEFEQILINFESYAETVKQTYTKEDRSDK